MSKYTGKTIEEILEQASNDKGCPTSELKYSVVEEKKGLLGLGNTITAEVYSMDDVKEFLFDYLGNFFTSIDQDIEVSIEQKRDNSFVVNLNADNNAILIGKMGKTLAAFNTVVRAAVNAEFKERIEVLIDINRYKEDRYAKVRAMGKRIAKQVQKSKVDVELDPLPSDERKIIHKVLSEWNNIKTESVGEGINRHLCIRYVPNPGEELELNEPAYEDEYEDFVGEGIIEDNEYLIEKEEAQIEENELELEQEESEIKLVFENEDLYEDFVGEGIIEENDNNLEHEDALISDEEVVIGDNEIELVFENEETAE